MGVLLATPTLSDTMVMPQYGTQAPPQKSLFKKYEDQQSRKEIEVINVREEPVTVIEKTKRWY